jgi:hypothetical protein
MGRTSGAGSHSVPRLPCAGFERCNNFAFFRGFPDQTVEEIERFSTSDALDDAQKVITVLKRGSLPQQCSCAALLWQLLGAANDVKATAGLLDVVAVRTVGVAPDTALDALEAADI